MKKIYKRGNDFVLALQMITSDIDENLQLTRATQFREINIRVYTNDIDEYILAHYDSAGQGTWINIVEQEDFDFIILSKEELAKLEDGIMKIRIDYRLGSAHFNSNTYTETHDFETEYYLFDKIYDSSECNKCKLIND